MVWNVKNIDLDIVCWDKMSQDTLFSIYFDFKKTWNFLIFSLSAQYGQKCALPCILGPMHRTHKLTRIVRNLDTETLTFVIVTEGFLKQ